MAWCGQTHSSMTRGRIEDWRRHCCLQELGRRAGCSMTWCESDDGGEGGGEGDDEGPGARQR